MSKKRNWNGKSNSKSNLVTTQMNKYADLNFSYYPGSPLLADASGNENHYFQSIPTLLRADFIPTIGAFGSVANAPINQATAQLFAKLRSDNSGKVNYSSTDLMIFIMSKRSHVSFHAWGSRILGLVNWYSGKDFNIPDIFYEASAVDLDDFRKHRVELSAYLDSFALNANTLAVPNVFPIIQEDVRLCGNVYKLDESNDMGQYLIFEPLGFYKYEENPGSGTAFGTLTWLAIDDITGEDHKLNFDEFCALGDTLIMDAKTSEDHYIMCGDIRKSFGENLYTIDAISSDYKLEPVFDKEILDRLHNADIFSNPNMGAITQDGVYETITQEITFNMSPAIPLDKPILLDSVDWDPAREKVVDIMTWKAAGTRTSESSVTLTASGPQVIVNIMAYWKQEGLGVGKFATYTVAQYFAQTSSALFMARNFALRTYFGNCLPFQYYSTTDDVYILGKPRCCTIITEDQIRNVNKVKFYELFGVGSSY